MAPQTQKTVAKETKPKSCTGRSVGHRTLFVADHQASLLARAEPRDIFKVF